MRDLRDRPVRRGTGDAERQAAATSLAVDGDGGRYGARSGGPASAGTGDGDVDRTQHHAGVADATAACRVHSRGRRASVRPRLGATAAGQIWPPQQSDDLALGREPAEGGAREVARATALAA